MVRLHKAQPKSTRAEPVPKQADNDVAAEGQNSDTSVSIAMPKSDQQAKKATNSSTKDTSIQTDDTNHEEKQKPTSPTRPKPRYSFFDNTSDSEYSVDGDESQLVVGRASSVRVGKPLIIQHKHTKNSQIPDSNLNVASSQPSKPAALQLVSLPATAEEDGETSATGVEISSNVHNSVARYSSQEHIPKALPTGSTIHSTHPAIVSAISTEANLNEELQGTDGAMPPALPLPGKGLSRRVTIRPSDLIIKNNKERSSFHEHIITTPYPKRRESDSISMDFDASKDNSTDSITANPERQSTVTATESPTASRSKKGKFKATEPSSSPGAKDRFPSPERSETLFLDLSLHRHPLARTTLEIQIPNKSIFDDEHLFTQIRAAYTKQLLGTRRWPLTLLRRIGYVTSSDTQDFNNIDFLKHLQNPRLGRKRKAWVIWLRNNNPRTAARACALVPPTSAHIKTLQSLDELASKPRKMSLTQTVFGVRRGSRNSSNRSHHTEKNPVAGVDDHPFNKRFSVASDVSTAGSFNFVYSPGMPRLPFLNQPQKGSSSPTQAVSPVRSFFWPNNLSSALNSSTPQSHANESGGAKIVTVSFQHEFRFGVMALLTLLVVVQAAVAALVWVIFGVPGSRPGMDGREELFGLVKSDWRVDAGARVLTGVIIGLVVFLVGCLLEGALVWGSWMLL